MTIGELLSFGLLALVWFGMTFLAFMIVFGEKIFAKPQKQPKVIYIEVEVPEGMDEDDIIIDISTGEIKEKKEVANV
jgi:membrane-associated protease RseP (regulator of RpoE activity)